MIELKNITFSYEGRDQGGLHDINLTVKDGECILLCGRSGCGKTDRKSTRLNSSHDRQSRMPSSA